MNKKILFIGFLSLIIGTLLVSTTVTSFAAEEIYVDVEYGSDQDGDGSQSSPYKTITKAVQVANDSMGHDEVHVAEGIYNLNTGEKFPLIVKNLNLIGKPDDLDAVKIATQMTFKNSLVKGVHFYRSVKAEDGSTIQKNAFSGINGDALNVRGSCKVEDNLFNDTSRPIDGGVSGGSLAIINNNFVNNSRAASLHASREGEIAISSNQVKAKEGRAGFNLKLLGGNGRIIVQNNEIIAENGMVVSFHRGGGRALIIDNNISVDETGLNLSLRDSGGEVILSRNRISGQNSVTIAKSGNVKADLGGGPLESSGKNVFQASKYCIKYELPPYNGKIYAKNNTWKDAYGNTFEPPTTLEGRVDTDHFYIEDEGNKIVFSD